MQLRHMKTLAGSQGGAAKITALAWSPNNNKLAVCGVDRVVVLYDDQGERRDKFATKPADPSLGKKCYQVSGLAFSPDSSKIAVGQTDNIIFVYKIGDEWGEKKVICNKFILQSAVTCLVWPSQQSSLIFGQADGKVKIAGTKGSKSQTIYAIDSYTVSLAVSPSGKGIISGHADGTIVRYFFEEDGAGLARGPICRHSCSPYALAWTNSTIIAAGCDRKITVYGSNGRVVQNFDHSMDDDEKEFTCAACSPSGQSFVVGSFDRLRVFNWSPRKESWEEAPSKDIANIYTISALSWKKDGSRLVAGSLCGSVELFDCCLRRVMYKDKFEMTYVGLSQVIVKNISTGSRVVLKSHYGCEIEQVKIMGHDRFLIAHTSKTLLLGDLVSCKLSEVSWQGTGGNEKFYFDNENVCMIFNAGELSLMEYGASEMLGSVRTEFVNPHLISVRINERKQKDAEQCKKLAYLVDLHTICIVDLFLGVTLGSITHDCKVNWLELNETGRKLLFRDKKLRLHLYDVENQTHSSLLNYCSYVQWVPLSDVVVAQSRNNLCVWYNIDMPDKISMFQIKGEVVNLERHNGRTEVLVQTGIDTVSFALDEGLIEFGTAIDDEDYQRALAFLETLEMTKETEAMWKTLAELTFSSRQLIMSERCYAALGDVAKARYLGKVIELVDKIEAETGQADGTEHYLVQAKLAILSKQFKQAEAILLERGEVDQAMTMYQDLYRWEDAIAVAAARGHPELQNLRSSHFQWLMDTGQEEKAGELREKEGDLLAAITLYMKAGLPAKAAKLVTQHQELGSQLDLLEQIASSLVTAGLYEKAGDLYTQVRNFQQAMEAYRAGGAFRRAIELARTAYPSEVVTLEEQWGDKLSSHKQFNAAITHYIEAGCLQKAVEAAIQARQWTKATQILELQEPGIAGEYYRQIAEHYGAIKDYQQAEQYYLKAGMVQEVMDMYLKADCWEQAYKHAQNCMAQEEIHSMYVSRAHELEEAGKLKEAEKLYVVVEEADLAISMYKKAKQFDAMTRLVGIYHKDLLNDTHLLLAKELEAEGQYKQAERHYVEALSWKEAVNMYRSKDLWEDAYRMAKAEGGSNAANQVAYLWAKSLGGESAVKLLTKFGLLEAAIEYATKNQAFDFAFTVAKMALKTKLPELHLKYALFLEDEGKYASAEEAFVNAGKPKEAVLMYVHQQNWDAAQKVAELHCPDSVADVLVGQARSAFERKDFQKAETYFLRAEKPELIAKFYKEADMWPDALRIVKEYLPQKLDEFQREMSSNSGENYEELLSQGHLWEQNGEHNHAIDLYLQLNPGNCPDKHILQEHWEKAVDLAIKFAPNRATDVAALVCDRLANLGLFVNAGEVMLSVKMAKEALDMFMSGEAWDRARDIARNIAPRYEQYVEEAYVQYLKQHNKPDEMSSVDPDGALKIYSQSGEWDKCLELAQQQGPNILAKYVALNAADLIRSKAALSALQLFTKYGSPAVPQNFNIYKHLCAEVYGQSLEGVAGYSTYASLRNLLLGLVEELSNTTDAGSLHHREFERHLLISHYLATRAAFQEMEQLKPLVAKLSTSLLRYTDILPADKAFYEGGLHCKAVGWENMAFIFFNRFLDLSEAIEEGSLDGLDNSDFIDTDIPFEVPLPPAVYMPEGKREEIKEWVLAVSIDQRVEQVLPTDERGIYSASLHCPHTQVDSLPCMVTGYPVLRHKVDFKRGGRCANKEDWNKFIMATKMSRTEECVDVWKFLSKWCGTANSPSYSFQ